MADWILNKWGKKTIYVIGWIGFVWLAITFIFGFVIGFLWVI